VNKKANTITDHCDRDRLKLSSNGTTSISEQFRGGSSRLLHASSDSSAEWGLSYDSEVYASLPPFEDARQRIDGARAAVDEAGTIIRFFGFEGALGVSLLHRHFALSPHEVLCRAVERPNMGSARPEAAASDRPRLGWIWRFAEGASGLGWYPLEFVRPWSDVRGVSMFVAEAGPVLDVLAQALSQRGVTDLVGVAALYGCDGFFAHPGCEIQETTDEAGRQLCLTVVPTPTGPRPGVTQTLWRWSSPLPTHGDDNA
jgi:hypothetical protein